MHLSFFKIFIVTFFILLGFNACSKSSSNNDVPETTPILLLKGDNPLTVIQGAPYNEPGALAVDAKDGNISVVITGSVDTGIIGTYVKTYTATNTYGNSAITTRNVNVVLPSYTPPVIILNGSNPMNVALAEPYNEPGATATDAEDGNISVVITGSVDTTVVGTYLITYTATDSDGVSTVSTRDVKVVIPAGVKKTGQTKSFDKEGNEVTDGSIKDDGYEQTGITRLYTRDKDLNITTDHISKLMWQDDPAVKNATNIMNQADAATYCTGLTLGGFTDWRVPTIEELLDIVDKGYYGPAVDGTVFQNVNTAGYFYWSSSKTKLRIGQGWTVYFEAGTDHYRSETLTYNVRCVRDE